jgi:hypothetical protein
MVMSFGEEQVVYEWKYDERYDMAYVCDVETHHRG